MAKEKTAQVELFPESPKVQITANPGESKDQCELTIDASSKSSKESIPEGTITKESKTLEVIADETITHEIKSSQCKSEMTKEKINLQVGESKLCITSDSIELAFGEFKVKISAQGVVIRGDKVNLGAGGSVNISSGKFSVSASQINMQ